MIDRRNEIRYRILMKRLLLLLALALCQTGCYVSQHELNTQISARVPVGTAISVVRPPDASYDGEFYEHSGQEMAGKLVAALTPYYPGTSWRVEEMAM